MFSDELRCRSAKGTRAGWELFQKVTGFCMEKTGNGAEGVDDLEFLELAPCDELQFRWPSFEIPNPVTEAGSEDAIPVATHRVIVVVL